MPAIDPRAQTHRLDQFLRLMLPVALGFVGVYLAAALWLGSAPLGLAALDVLGYALALVQARRLVGRGQVDQAARLVAYALVLMTAAGAPLLPWLLSGLVLIPVAGVAVMLPHLHPAELRRLMVITLGAEAWVLAAGQLANDVIVPPPLLLQRLVTLAAGTIAAGLIFLLLWRDSQQLRQAVEVAEANEAATRQGEERFRRIMESNLIGLILTADDGAVVDANQAFLNLVGYSPEDLRAGRVDWQALTPPEWKAVSDRALEELRTNRLAAPFEKEYQRPDGSRVPVLLASTRVESQQLNLTLVLDLSARKQAERESQARYLEAQAAVEARDRFLSIASHELKTPLTTLQLQMQSLLRASLRAGHLPPALGSMERQVRRLTALIDDLLDISRLTSGQLTLRPEPMDLAELSREVASRLEPQAERAGSAVEVVAPPGVAGHWDPLRLDQVLTNLLSNALKYGGGQPVTLRLTEGPAEVVLEVEDHGIGIPPEDQERIFGRFERAVSERHYSGLGLGLWIVRQVVVALGGSISLRSIPGQGSTFTVRLPRTEKPPSPAGG